MKFDKKEVFFSVVAVFFAVACLEAGLGLFAFISPTVKILLSSPSAPTPVALFVPDARLGHRPNPDYPGHDRNGFRNSGVPDSAHIVALGDSQTYGSGVKPEDAWPRQLASKTGKTVYNMAFGGYGPTHSLVLWDEALALSPKIVIEAFYAGNDLFDSFNHVYNGGQLPELRSSDPQLRARIRGAEQSCPIAKRVSQMFQIGIMPSAVDEEATTVTRANFSPRGFLSQHSKIYGVMRRARYEIAWPVIKPNDSLQAEWGIAKVFAETHPAYCQVFDNGKFETIFTSEYRLSALDLGDPRIAEGLQISLKAIQRMHEFAAARGIRFLVMLIPTKETVFRELWQTPSINYRNLAENEESVWKLTKYFLERNGIEYLDSLPSLREQLVVGIQPYQVSQDGHPNKYGHQAIARLVSGHL